MCMEGKRLEGEVCAWLSYQDLLFAQTKHNRDLYSKPEIIHIINKCSQSQVVNWAGFTHLNCKFMTRVEHGNNWQRKLRR